MLRSTHLLAEPEIHTFKSKRSYRPYIPYRNLYKFHTPRNHLLDWTCWMFSKVCENIAMHLYREFKNSLKAQGGCQQVHCMVDTVDRQSLTMLTTINPLTAVSRGSG